jgi:hypothetical protein
MCEKYARKIPSIPYFYVEKNNTGEGEIITLFAILGKPGYRMALPR